MCILTIIVCNITCENKLKSSNWENPYDACKKKSTSPEEGDRQLGHRFSPNDKGLYQNMKKEKRFPCKILLPFCMCSYLTSIVNKLTLELKKHYSNFRVSLS